MSRWEGPFEVSLALHLSLPRHVSLGVVLADSAKGTEEILSEWVRAFAELYMCRHRNNYSDLTDVAVGLIIAIVALCVIY